MNLTLRFFFTFSVLAFPVTGCEDHQSNPVKTEATGSSTTTSANIIDNWLGKWNGPEGTFLQLAGNDGEYEITIQNLDGPRTFPAQAVGNHIEFERDGVKEILRATNGVETGMKWLSEKSDCLTIRLGEGYCRD